MTGCIFCEGVEIIETHNIMDMLSVVCYALLLSVSVVHACRAVLMIWPRILEY